MYLSVQCISQLHITVKPFHCSHYHFISFIAINKKQHFNYGSKIDFTWSDGDSPEKGEEQWSLFHSRCGRSHMCSVRCKLYVPQSLLLEAIKKSTHEQLLRQIFWGLKLLKARKLMRGKQKKTTLTALFTLWNSEVAPQGLKRQQIKPGEADQ